MAFSDIKAEITEDLHDNGVTFSNDDLNLSLQDAYDDIAVLTKCIIKREEDIEYLPNLSYYPFNEVVQEADYIETIAIYDQTLRDFLCCDITLKKLDAIDCRWERTIGSPQYWIPASVEHTIIYPKREVDGFFFDLFYAARAPAVVDEDAPLMAVDMLKLLNLYVVADMLEAFREYKKASNFWKQYYSKIADYALRTKELSKSDLLILF